MDDQPAFEVATSDAIRMEVLAGARDEQHLRQLRRLLARASVLPTESLDYETAAALYRACRQRGERVREPVVCLIAAVAIRGDVPILHRDAGFDTLARHMALQVEAV